MMLLRGGYRNRLSNRTLQLGDHARPHSHPLCHDNFSCSLYFWIPLFTARSLNGEGSSSAKRKEDSWR